MAGPPPPTTTPWHRRYWGYYNRPYGGCGCLYSLLLLALVWWLCALIFPALAFWRPVAVFLGLPI